ncbi:MAG: T9SS type A sorting domain-containing protein, partial [Bacteroidales bacterium]|nr:T9SS type A sorting domain-containing protein [Bacteroidales bacterium]
GATWSTPVKVNQDPSGAGKEHYFPWITCDPSSGILSAVFYDDRNVSSTQCEVFCANSFDAGDTWEDFKVSDVFFTPSPIPGLAGGYMGDYLGIIARDSYVYPCWTDNRGGLYMTYVSPYVTNNLPHPSDLIVTLNETTGATTLDWQFDGEDFLHFVVYRDGNPLGTTNDLTYSDNLPDYGIYTYSVTAMHDDGESVGANASVQWGNAQINVNPPAFNVALEPGASTVETLTIENIGELELSYNIITVITTDKGSKDYCDASGGCDEYISNVTLGDINNSSACDGYADYTDLSTNLNPEETYDITVVNGTYYSTDDLGVWIDWNQDQDFDDAGENVVCESNNGGQGTYSFTVPADAVAGETRMRIRIKYYDSDCGDPCGTTTYGEVEDYSVYVLGWLLLDQTEGTLDAGNSDEINVTFEAADHEAGTYTAHLNISSNDPDDPMITIPVTLLVGDDIPNVDVYAEPADICEGESSQLFADATGGSGNYTYSWTSDPEGFTSDVQNPVISPEVTTTYFVEVYDGVYTVVENTTVDVSPLPEVSETPEGEVELCQNSANTTYNTAETAYALSYIWNLSPAEAGTISGGGIAGIVNWSFDFSGEALISVKGVNDCGEGELSDELTVQVNALPEVSINLTDSVCIYTPAFDLTGGSPAGGEYAGDGVDNGLFDPEVAGVGDHIITYTYVDNNGCENFAETSIYVGECLGINEIVDGMHIEIFPNPSKGKFTIKVNSINNETANLKIINNLGVTVYSENNINLDNTFKTEINLGDYSEGLYFINILTDETNYIKKIVIRK